MAINLPISASLINIKVVLLQRDQIKVTHRHDERIRVKGKVTCISETWFLEYKLFRLLDLMLLEKMKQKQLQMLVDWRT